MLISILKGILVALVAYGLGSLSFAYIITKALTGKDIRTMGSGNAGFSNCLRVLPKAWAFLVFGLDVLKGYLAGLMGIWLLGHVGAIIALIFAIVGHSYPFWLQFRGGKGIATGLGGLLALSPLMGLSLLGVWAVVVLLSNYISLGSVAAAICMPIFAILFHEPAIYIVLFLLAGILVVYKHRGNLVRIKNGTEAKLFKQRGK